MARTTRYQGASIQSHHSLLTKHHHHDNGREHWIIPGGGRAPGVGPRAG
jgi:hypothetical protein